MSGMMLYGWFVHQIASAKAMDDVAKYVEWKQKDKNSLISVGCDCWCHPIKSITV